jgi:hypothetical protein
MPVCVDGILIIIIISSSISISISAGPSGRAV